LSLYIGVDLKSEHRNGSMNSVHVAVVADKVVVRCIEVAVFFADPAERGAPRSEDRELGLHGVSVNFSPCVFAYAVIHRFMAGETSKGTIRWKVISVHHLYILQVKSLKRRRSTVLVATSAIGTSLTGPLRSTTPKIGGLSTA